VEWVVTGPRPQLLIDDGLVAQSLDDDTDCFNREDSMTPSARSLSVFAVYLLLLGAVLLVAPNLLLETFGLPPTSEVWIRVVGMLVTFLGVYYRTAAAAELVAFFRVTVLLRLSVPVFFLLFVLAGWASWPLLLFGAIDILGAAWTWWALQRPQHPNAA
jgi:hypothetical protein